MFKHAERSDVHISPDYFWDGANDFLNRIQKAYPTVMFIATGENTQNHDGLFPAVEVVMNPEVSSDYLLIGEHKVGFFFADIMSGRIYGYASGDFFDGYDVALEFTEAGDSNA